jgi:hypothetical protein
MNGFIEHLHTWLRTTSNCSATANLHNSQITTAPAKPFPACYVFTGHSLAMASNSGDSSASRAQVLSSQPSMQNCLTADLQTPHSQQQLYYYVRICCGGNVFTELLPRNGPCLQSHRLAMDLYTTISSGQPWFLVSMKGPKATEWLSFLFVI